MKIGSSGASPRAMRSRPSSLRSTCVPRATSVGPFSAVTSTSGKFTASWYGGVCTSHSGNSPGESRCTSCVSEPRIGVSVASWHITMSVPTRRAQIASTSGSNTMRGSANTPVNGSVT